MAEFLVKMANERGHLRQQLEHGYSESEVRDRFVQQGFLGYWVKPRGMFVGGQFSYTGSRRLKQSSYLIYNQQFLTLIKAGLPILTSQKLLLKRETDEYLQTLLHNVRDRLNIRQMLS